MAKRAADATRVSVFGIRHHGPGSARSLCQAFDETDPAIVLIEGPPEADDLIGFAANPAMKPPVALLLHSIDDPGISTFYPFAVYSPEWQAMRWALGQERPARFIDLPASHRLALRAAEASAPIDTPENATGDVPSAEGEPDQAGAADAGPETTDPADVPRDPLAYLAAIAGYDDGEAWWNALIEQGANAPTIFTAVETAMKAS